jgi:hypothetical protein
MVHSHQVSGQLRGFKVPVPADQDRGEAHEAVQQRDELGHAGHFHDAGAPEPDSATDQHRYQEQDQAGESGAAMDSAVNGPETVSDTVELLVSLRLLR